jgi:hypothetical protein
MILAERDSNPEKNLRDWLEKELWYCPRGSGRAKVLAIVKDLSDLDLDEQALVKKKRPWGWFVAGLVFLLSVTFALAFTVPLSNSHEALTAEHEKLAKKASELDRAFINTKKQLDETEEKRRGLDKTITDVREARKELASRLEMSSKTVEGSLTSIMKAKLAEVTPSEEELTVTIKNKALFLPRSSKMNPSMGRLLCKVIADGASDKSWRTKIAIAFAADDKDAWEKAGEQAAALGTLLSDRCELASESFLVGVQPKAEAKDADSTTFCIGPDEVPRLPEE